ncbi:MAG: histidine kinase, partial [Bacteroidales bacterium]
FDDNGKILNSYEFDFKIRSSVHFTDYNGHDFLAISTMENGVFLFDSDINLVKQFPDLSFTNAFLIDDINHDGHDELVNFDLQNNQLKVFRTSFRNCASEKLDLPVINPSRFCMSLIKKANEYSEISMQVDSYHLMFKYRENPFYYFNHFLFWPIYFSILGFVFLNKKIFDKQINKKHRIEKKLSALQLKLFKKLIDPHYSMNVINSVIIALNNNEKDVAVKNLQRFAKLHHSIFFTENSIQHNIEDEISVVKEYMDFEKSRDNSKLLYQISLDANVLAKQKIPKLLILAFVYYSLNSELINIKDDSKIEIKITQRNKRLEIIIMDNIIKKPIYNIQNNQTETNLLDSLNSYILHYNSLYNEKITLTTSHTHDDNKMISGSKVIITKSGIK